MIFSRLDTIPACDIQPAIQPSFDSKDRAYALRVSRSKNIEARVIKFDTPRHPVWLSFWI